jgi:hypothetical protein
VLRCLKRYIAREAYQTLRADLAVLSSPAAASTRSGALLISLAELVGTAAEPL